MIREDPSAEVLLGESIISEYGNNFWDPCAIQRQITGENKSTDPCDPNGGGCQDQYTQVGPLLTTTWDQGCGYNQLMPSLTCSGVCDKAWVGCVAVAMAQVMRYHSYPQGYNYSSMPPNSGNIHNATLMADIFNAFPSNQQLVYCFGTGISNTGNNYSNVFINSFGYTSAITSSYNSATVRNNLNQGRPVILGGGGSQGTLNGHMWVTDGYLRSVFCSGQTLLKLNMNWGWNGIGNGFFNFDNFSVTVNGVTRSYNNDKYMIYNIIP